MTGLAGRLLHLARLGASRVAPRVQYRSILRRQQNWGPRGVLSFDVDFPRDVEVLPELAAQLSAASLPASFACIGRWVREYPREHATLVDAGFEILNHTEDHPNLYHPEYDYARAADLSRDRFNQIGFEARRREIVTGHQTISDVLGVVPAGFRTPHFGSLHVDDVYGILDELEYRFSSSTMAWSRPEGGIPYRATPGIWEFPVSPCPDHPVGVFDSWHAIGKKGASHAGPGDLSRLFDLLLRQVAATGGFANVYFDPFEMVRTGEMARILDCALEVGVEFTTYGALCNQLDADDLPS